MKSIVVIFIFLAFIPTTCHTQIFGAAARTEFFGGFGIRSFYARINKTSLFIDGEKAEAAAPMNVFVNATPVAIVYGAAPRLSLIGVFPTIFRTLERTIDGAQVRDTHSGLGDVTLFAKYRFYKKDGFLASRQLAFQAGIKLPTGADDLEDSSGMRLPPPLQLGSGSFDYSFLLTLTDFRHRFVLTGDLGYQIKNAANDFKAGDVFNYDLAAKYRIFPAMYKDDSQTNDFFIFLELNGVVGQKADHSGSKIANSGGHQIFLAPGFQFFPLANLILEVGIQIPFLQNLNGTQLGTDFHLRTGIRWIILP